MYQIDFQNPIHLHFNGIGGNSMSGLAEILLKEGFRVSGSDTQESALTRRLEGLGATVFFGQRASNIKDGVQACVYTAAIHEDNPELRSAIEKGVPLLTRAELLGQIMANYPQSIAVAGTHGKTTTTSMIAEILLAAGADPTVSVGGILGSIGGNIRVGGSGVFLTEACEYTNSFLHFYPEYALILNIEEDHMDFFKNLAEIRRSFRSFAGNVKEGGAILINGEIEDVAEIAGGLGRKVITYGFSPSDTYHAADISCHEKGGAGFTLMREGERVGEIRLRVPGRHNISNATAAAALAMEMGLPFSAVRDALFAFTGTKRRFERKGTVGGVDIIDDYAHHPTEIAATLMAAKSYGSKRIVCVFQPHTYTRTQAFLKEFAKALSLSDVVVLSDIYAAREKNTIGVSSKDILRELQALGCESYYFPSFDEIENFLLKFCMNGDLLITMGAGDIVLVGEHLLGQ